MALVSCFISGWVILIAAVLLNLAADRLGIIGWYGFLTGLASEGRFFLNRTGWKDISWLFFVYPLLLGYVARWGVSIAEMLTSKINI